MIIPEILLANTMVRHNERLAQARVYHRPLTWQDNDTPQVKPTSRWTAVVHHVTQKIKATKLPDSPANAS